MPALKRCKQCGILKDVESFRQYTYSRSHGSPGRYRICRECESINQTYRKAKALLDAGGVGGTNDVPAYLQPTVAVVNRIEALYEALQRQGLQVPEFRAKKEKTVVDRSVDKLLAFYGQAPGDEAEPAGSIAATRVPTESPDLVKEVPEDLQVWLDDDPDNWKRKGLSPEYLQDMVYESLKAKYRPQVGFDRDQGLPIYDDTYKDVLNQILRRFDDYEEDFMGEED